MLRILFVHSVQVYDLSLMYAKVKGVYTRRENGVTTTLSLQWMDMSLLNLGIFADKGKEYVN